LGRVKSSRRALSATEAQRRTLFAYCHIVLHARADVPAPGGPWMPARTAPQSRMTPRMHQTLKQLLEGASEKQIAGRLQISRHTVHVYVKKLYRRYQVSSKGELFADWVRRGGGLARHP
jgi:DNA-binding CsgD family transcriptional regulator